MSGHLKVLPIERKDHPIVFKQWTQLMTRGQNKDPRFSISHRDKERFRQWSLTHWFEHSLPFPPLWVAWKDGDIVGFIEGYPEQHLLMTDQAPSARIGNLWVNPTHRRLGVGTALVQTFRNACKEKGYLRFFVGTLFADPEAIAFWKTEGFTDWQVLLSDTPTPS